VRLLDGLVRYRFGGNAELMGAWASARNVEGPNRSKAEPLGQLRSLLDEWLPRRGKVLELRVLDPNSEYVCFDLGSGMIAHRGPLDRKENH